jgi:hypothetical protein
MSGELPGIYFKLVIGNLLSAQILFPEYRSRIEAMAPDKMYPWDEYTKMARDIAEKLPESTVVMIGKRIVRESKASFAAQGFDSVERILGDWKKLFSANIIGAPDEDFVSTIRFEPGKATLKAGLAQPARLVEGYLRGVVEMYGRRVKSFSMESGPGRKFNLMHIEWE